MYSYTVVMLFLFFLFDSKIFTAEKKPSQKKKFCLSFTRSTPFPEPNDLITVNNPLHRPVRDFYKIPGKEEYVLLKEFNQYMLENKAKNLIKRITYSYHGRRAVHEWVIDSID